MSTAKHVPEADRWGWLARRLLAAVMIATLGPAAMFVAEQEVRALSCAPPGPRVVARESDAVVVARRVASIKRKRADDGYGIEWTDRYVVEEWLKGQGPRRIVVTQRADDRPSSEPVGLALSHVKGRRYAVPLCTPIYEPETVRSAVAPVGAPTGEGPAALFVGLADEHSPDASTEVWLDRTGRVVARDRGETRGFAVCPGGERLVQVRWGPPYRAADIDVRDLDTLETIERFSFRSNQVTGQLACRDERADEILLATPEGFVNARDDSFVVERRYYEDHQTIHTTLPMFGRDFAVGLREDATLESVDLSDGSVYRVLAAEDGTVIDFDLDPSGERIAVLVRDPETKQDSIVIKTLGAPAAASDGADLRVMSAVVGAPPLDIVAVSGDVLVEDLGFLEPVWITLPPGEHVLTVQGDEGPVELDPIRLDAGERRSLFIVEPAAADDEAAGAGPGSSPGPRFSAVTDADVAEVGEADGYAVRVLNASAEPADVRVGRAQARYEFEDVPPRTLSDSITLAPPSRGLSPIAHLRGPRVKGNQRRYLSTPVPGDRYTVVVTDRVGGRGGCRRGSSACLLEVLDDAAPARLGGTELVRAQAPRSPRWDAHVAWLDDDRIAHVALQRPRPEDPDRGRVAILDADELAVQCEWRGWNHAPEAVADGVLFAAEWPSRLVAVNAMGGDPVTITDGVAYPRPIVPLPAFDGTALVGDGTRC